MDIFNPEICGKKLFDSEYGVIGIKDEDQVLNLLVKDKGIAEGFCIIFTEENEKKAIGCNVYKIKSNGQFASSSIRGKCIYDIFRLWTALGYNTRKAKDPFNSKAFLAVLDKMFDNENDTYVLVRE
jgi:hypothetical protein